MESAMHRGTVSSADRRLGYWLIRPDQGTKELFVFGCDTHGIDTRALRVGQRVEFDIGHRGKGSRAVNVAWLLKHE
jgi:cold shock CspA family protein